MQFLMLIGAVLLLRAVAKYGTGALANDANQLGSDGNMHRLA